MAFNKNEGQKIDLYQFKNLIKKKYLRLKYQQNPVFNRLVNH